ncbi:hypothetical protein AXG93_1130s1650 [Marchantia polymorpha subsp. ruderalis]|uniref:GPN-loop GTPase 3 n=3 Tax=Marchantia polymorpha TaxID=3197 RepID=A0A176VHV9_MARPO|nr:hypothetical protein AXG93_1130s1650 [Marchantia polymorpha subsp. ruderalis]
MSKLCRTAVVDPLGFFAAPSFCPAFEARLEKWRSGFGVLETESCRRNVTRESAGGAMPRYAQLVIGPAGSGKSTYCHNLYQHCQSVGRVIHIVNLDPAAETFRYPVSVDIRELISLEDVMEELKLGPNGGLVYCMEYLEENLDDWLSEQLEDYIDDDYLVFDCPGQIELYSHIPVLRTFVDQLKKWDFAVCAVYMLDSQFASDVTKYISGCMASLSAMIQLEVPHVNVLTKMDLLPSKSNVDKFLDPDARLLLGELNDQMAPRFQKLNKALAELVDDYSMVSFLPLDIRDEESIQYLLSHIDNAIQFGEDAEVKIKDYDADMGESEDAGNFDMGGEDED